MQTGEVLRREVFNLLDAAKGDRLKKLKEVNKHEIVEGVTEDYMERRVQTLLSYVKQPHKKWCSDLTGHKKNKTYTASGKNSLSKL